MQIRSVVSLLLLATAPLGAQAGGWFHPSLLEQPDVKLALTSVDDRSKGIVDEWIELVEIPAPSRKEQARAQYIRAEMVKLGLTDIRTDEMSNVSGVRKGTGGGPTVVFAAHMDTVFPEGTDLTVKREGRHPARAGHGRRHVEPDGHARDVPGAQSRQRQDQGGPDLPRVRPGRARAARREALARGERLQAGHVRRGGRRRPRTSGTARCASRSSSSSTRRPARTRWRAATARARREPWRRRSKRSTRYRCRRSSRASAPSSCPSSTSACSAAERS